MKYFVEKDASSRRKINWKEKRRKKNISTSQKINCPLARMSFFSQNCLLHIPIMVSTNNEIALTKNYCFHQAENPFALAEWKILKNTFLLYGKAASTLKNLWKIGKNAVHWQEYGSSLKTLLPDNFNNSFHIQKKTWS